MGGTRGGDLSFLFPFLFVRYGYRFAGLLRILYIGNNRQTSASFVLNKRWIDGNSNYSLFRKIKRNYIFYSGLRQAVKLNYLNLIASREIIYDPFPRILYSISI